MFIALLGRDTTGHRTVKVGTIISPTHLLLDSGLVGNIAEEEMLHLSKRWVRLDMRGVFQVSPKEKNPISCIGSSQTDALHKNQPALHWKSY